MNLKDLLVGIGRGKTEEQKYVSGYKKVIKALRTGFPNKYADFYTRESVSNRFLDKGLVTEEKTGLAIADELLKTSVAFNTISGRTGIYFEQDDENPEHYSIRRASFFK